MKITLHALRLAFAVAVVVTSVVLLIQSPAHADQNPITESDTKRWISNVFCVQDETRPGMWPIEEAVAVLDAIDNIMVIYDDCDGVEQRISIREADFHDWKSKDVPAGVTYRCRDGHRMTCAWVEVNNTHPVAYDPATSRPLGVFSMDSPRWTMAERQTIVTHELLHAFGLDHTRSEDSIMGPDPYEFVFPTLRDISELAARYAPRGYTYRPAWRYVPQ